MNRMKRVMIKKFFDFMSANIVAVVYGVLSISLELVSLVFFDCCSYVIHPLYPLLLWFSIVFTLIWLKSKRLKAIYSFFFLFVQCFLILGFNYLFLSNGTVFEKSMLQQRNDAYATIEQLYLSPGLLILCAGTSILYFTFLIFYIRKCRNTGHLTINYNKRNRRVMLVLNMLLVISLFLDPISDDLSRSASDYEALLYKSENSYQKLGITSNFVYEMLHGDRTNLVDLFDVNHLASAIYAKRADTSKHNGISRGNNLIMILAESFEWYPLQRYPRELTARIYPNLSRLMEEGVICDNFYSREKTDTAEALTLVGSNPTGKYVHNDFAENAYPYSLPNLFRQEAALEGQNEVIIRSYHQNTGSFYNRSVIHKSLGFQELVDVNAMKEYGVVNTWDSDERERTLDSLTMEAMKDEMFPVDQRFFTYWITFSSHGFYNKRENLSGYYDSFDQLSVFPQGDKYTNYLRTYAAAVADLDKAVGIMFEDLEKKGLLDTTTIVMVADHNTYYNGLSNYAKGIDTRFNPELYRVPMMIYDRKLAAALELSGDRKEISKFTTTSDVVPTICDLLGIPAWDNLYLGSTIFNRDKESIIYSRAYNIFINDKVIGYSLNDLRYKAPGASKETIADFELRALAHLNKLAITDKIFYSDYFKNHKYMP